MKLLVTLNNDDDVKKLTSIAEAKRLTPATFARSLIADGLKQYEVKP